MNGSVNAVVAALRERSSFILTSHARPDGDAIGSSVALALALQALGKRTRVVLKDPIPEPYRAFPELDRVEQAGVVNGAADAAILLECSDAKRPEVAGLDAYFLINIDHHLGNTNYGAVNWFDVSAAACGELVADLIDALGVRWTPAIASHLYLALSTDTGGFRYGPISERTYDICRRITASGVHTPTLSRQIFDSFSIGRVRLTGALLNSMELYHQDRLAVLCFDEQLLRQSGATLDDTEGLVNLPLAAREVVAVALLKTQDASTFRVSLRSKGPVDVSAIAARWGGGGHRNAAGATLTGTLPELKRALVDALRRQIDASDGRHPPD